MPRKPIELKLAVARRFVEDMRAFFAEPNATKRDEIAGLQMSVLRQYCSIKDRGNSQFAFPTSKRCSCR